MITGNSAPPTIKDLLREAHQALPDPLEPELLLAHVLERSRSYLHAWPEKPCGESETARYRTLLSRRIEGEPIAYLLGHREFWSLELHVTPDTLIPRPETETLVERALESIPPRDSWSVLDLGTGSGAVALALAKERGRCRFIATDQSHAALEVARRNAVSHAVTNVEFRQGLWWEAVGDLPFQVIVSNPPYIPSADPHLDQGDLRWEPRAALESGADGLDAIRQIVAGAPSHLISGGYLLLEHGYDQGAAVRDLFTSAGFDEIETQQDLSAQDRVTSGRYPG